MGLKTVPHAEELNERFPLIMPENAPHADVLESAIRLIGLSSRSRKHHLGDAVIMLILVVSAEQRTVTLRQVEAWLKGAGYEGMASDITRLLTEL